ncbi:uncharacterized protein LOC133289602 [Gastrolobium bilobum]|uniref:uncharacterized protein LOC133289602 n=1 Tax=Gastrolobium bilobum TaxID=150636 RepID=UPI002AB04F56|nr:uncharacterized protein LOC133289602 [Gastrolobium bilobum]
MAKAAEDAEFDKENHKIGVDAELDAAFGFPSEFPFEFDSFGTETESSDEEDFFAGLTRRLSQASLLNETRKQQLTVPILNSDKAESQKTLGLTGSPQSTLSGIGSWSVRSAGSGDGSPNGSSRVPSPTPFSAADDNWDVIYAAAGQVARLKMNRDASKFDFQNRGLLGGGVLPPPIAAENLAAALFANQSLSQVQYQRLRQEQVLKQQCGSVWGRQGKASWSTQQQQQQQQQQVQNRVREFGYEYESVNSTRPLPQSAWHHPLQVKPQNQQILPHGGSGSRPVSQGGSGVKRGCAGTGVFLPRQYGAPPPESRKKTSCAPVLLPAKVIHALNLNIDDLNATCHPRFSSTFGVDYDALLARRNALLMQQKLSVRREEAANYEIRLPQEWTY